MKKYIILFYILALPVIGNELEFDRKSHNFGTMFQHEEKVTSIKITNTTNSIVKIVKVKPTCSCTWPSFFMKDLKPHESVELTVTYKSGYFKGKQNKSIFVETDQDQRYMLTFQSNVEERFKLIPEKLRVNNLEIGKSSIYPIKMDILPGAGEFIIEKIDFDKDLISINKQKPTSFDLIIHPNQKEDYGLKHITLHIKGAEKPVRYYINIEESEFYQLTPTAVSIINTKAGVKKSKKVILKMKTPFMIKQVKCLEDWMMLSSQNNISEIEAELEFTTIPSKMKRKTGKSKIIVSIESRDKKQQEIVIPLIFHLI